MGFVTANGIEMCVEEHGPASARPLLLIAGFSAQLVSWDPGFLDSLVDRGFRVITFDNVPTRLLDALEIVSIAYLLWLVKSENKKMLLMISKLKTDSDNDYAPSSVKGDVQVMRTEIAHMRDKMDTGFTAISTQIANLSNTVIAAVSQK